MFKSIETLNVIILWLIILCSFNLGKLNKKTTPVVQTNSMKAEYKIGKIKKDTLIVQKKIIGRISSKNNTILKPSIQGTIEYIEKEGQKVEKGATLVKLHTTEAEIKLNNAKNRMIYYEKEFNNAKVLFEKGFISSGEFAKLKAEFLDSQGKFEEAEFFYNSHFIKAPFDCFVSLSKQSISALINQQTELIEITSTKNEHEIIVEMPFNVIDKYDITKFIFEVLTPTPLKAEFVGIDGTINQNFCKLVKLKIVADENFKPSVNDYFNVNISYAKKTSAIQVPIEAIYYIEEVPYITVLKAIDSQTFITIRQKVEIGDKNNVFAQIKGDVNEGDLVLCNHQHFMHHGQKINKAQILI